MSPGVELATGDLDAIERAHGASGDHFLTCPERGRACAWSLGPDRPDDHRLTDLLDRPRCIACGVSLVLVPRGEYEGPPDEFRDLDQKGSPVVEVNG